MWEVGWRGKWLDGTLRIPAWKVGCGLCWVLGSLVLRRMLGCLFQTVVRTYSVILLYLTPPSSLPACLLLGEDIT